MRILMIGPWPLSIDHTGGTVFMFRATVEKLKQDDRFDPQVINTVRGRDVHNWFVNITTALRTLWLTCLKAPWADIISFQASRRGVILYGPLVFLISRLFNRPLVIRLFGGAFEGEYKAIGAIGRWIMDKTVLASDLFLPETKHLVGFFRQRGARCVEWFPNHTEQFEPSQMKQRELCERLVFLGRVVGEKGVGTILDAVPYLCPGVSVDVYGPLYEPYTAEMINSEGQGRVRYKGVLTLEQVREVLFEYDALVLPTFHASEGYPSVILQAYSHGLPVITTKWRSIPEIVDESSGILIAPQSPDDLGAAINRLHKDPALFQQLRRGAAEKSSAFSDQHWTNRFIELCQSLT